MKIGILFTVNEYTVDPASLARKMEALGFESLWIPEHAIIPVHTSTPLPESPPGQGQIPEVYSHICDPFIAMSLAAAVTTRLKLATGVMLVPERNPIVAAKEIATLEAQRTLVLGQAQAQVQKKTGDAKAELTAKTQTWTPETIRELETRLKSARYYNGPIDGRSGPALAPALNQWRLLGPPQKS